MGKHSEPFLHAAKTQQQINQTNHAKTKTNAGKRSIPSHSFGALNFCSQIWAWHTSLQQKSWQVTSSSHHSSMECFRNSCRAWFKRNSPGSTVRRVAFPKQDKPFITKLLRQMGKHLSKNQIWPNGINFQQHFPSKKLPLAVIWPDQLIFGWIFFVFLKGGGV